jgi:Uma2 family endonuclease
MIQKASKSEDFVTLTGVPWDSYVGLTDALAEHRLRHTYDRGLLELRREVLSVTWDEYRAFLHGLGDFHVRHVYDRGTLLIMSPLKSHDWIKRLIGRFIESMALDQRIAIQSIGSTTITSDLGERGFEADESYYIGNEHKVRGKIDFEPDVDPPPDLILEIDVTSSSQEQLSLYSAMKVPEVWLHDGTALTFLVRRRRGGYEQSATSFAFPFLKPIDIDRFLQKHASTDETSLTREFIAWARKRKNEWQRAEVKSTRPKKSQRKRPKQ